MLLPGLAFNLGAASLDANGVLHTKLALNDQGFNIGLGFEL